jgi:predicted Fe-Mo cluster-binding NifX family protein
MSLRFLKSAILLFVIIFFLPGIALAGGIKEKKEQAYAVNKLLIKFYDEVTKEKKEAVRKKFGAEIVKHLEKAGIEVWKLPDSKSVDDIIKELKKESTVESSEPDYIYQPRSMPGSSHLTGNNN